VVEPSFHKLICYWEKNMENSFWNFIYS